LQLLKNEKHHVRVNGGGHLYDFGVLCTPMLWTKYPGYGTRAKDKPHPHTRAKDKPRPHTRAKPAHWNPHRRDAETFEYWQRWNTAFAHMIEKVKYILCLSPCEVNFIVSLIRLLAS